MPLFLREIIPTTISCHWPAGSLPPPHATHFWTNHFIAFWPLLEPMISPLLKPIILFHFGHVESPTKPNIDFVSKCSTLSRYCSMPTLALDAHFYKPVLALCNVGPCHFFTHFPKPSKKLMPLGPFISKQEQPPTISPGWKRSFVSKYIYDD